MDITGFMKNAEIAQSKLVTFGQKATKVGSSISRGLGLAFALVGGAAVSTASEFNKVSVQLRSLVGKADFRKLSEQARGLGESTIFTRIQIVEAQKELAKLGTSGRDIGNIIPAISSLAGALDEDLAGSASAVKEALNIFRLEADQAGRVTDLYAQAVQSSALTIPQLREGLKNIGPILKQQNVSLEDSVALLALLANSAIKGSTAGTKLRSTFNKLAKSYSDGNVALAKFTEGNLEYSEILGILNSRAAVVGSILQDQGGDLKDLQVLFDLAGGAANRLSEEFEGELFFTVEQLKNAFQNLGIELGRTLVPATEVLRDIMVGLARVFTSLSPGTKSLLGTFIALTPVIAGLTFVVGQLTIAVAALSTASGLIVISLLAAAAAAAYFGGEVGFAAEEARKSKQLLEDSQDLRSSSQISDVDGTVAAITRLRGTYSALGEEIRDLTDLQRGTIKLGRKLAEEGENATKSQALTAVGSELADAYVERTRTIDQLRLERFEVDKAIVAARERAESQKALNQIFADGNKLQADAEDAEKRGVENSKKRSKLLLRAENELAKARAQQLPDYQRRLAEVNIKIKNLVDQLKAAGGTGDEIDGIAASLRAIATADIAADRTSFLADLNLQLERLTTGDIGRKLIGVRQQIAGIADEAADLGISSDQIAPLLELLETRLTGEVFEDQEDQANAKRKKAREEYTKFLRSDLENQIADHRQAVDNIVKDAELSVQEQRELYYKLDEDIRKLRKESADEAAETTVNQLRVVRDFANALGNAFSTALEGGTNFFKELGNAFLSFFTRIIGKLVSLIALYAILALLSGGTTAAGAPTGLASTASQLMGDGGLSGFLSGGLGFRSAQGGGDPMAFGSRIDGNDIVISNQNSGRQMTRIGG